MTRTTMTPRTIQPDDMENSWWDGLTDEQSRPV
jgi:hypothetical protein